MLNMRIHPVGENYPVTQRFLEENDFTRKTYKSGVHFGVDFGCKNIPVLAPTDGVVVDVILNNSSLGNCVFFDDGAYIHRFLHNESVKVSKGPIKAGTVMAISGNTGMGAAYHVHWDMMKKPFVFANLLTKKTVIENMIDPLVWLKQAEQSPLATYTIKQLVEELSKRV